MPEKTLSVLPDEPTIQDFRRFDGTLWVKNHSRNAVSCNTKEHQFLLGPAGSDTDCQVLPDHALGEAGFQKILRRKQVSISPYYGEDAAISEDRRDGEREARLREITELTEAESSGKDLVQGSCLVCDTMLFQQQQDVTDLLPPLCDAHKDQSNRFFGTEVQNEDGSIKVVFNPLH